MNHILDLHFTTRDVACESITLQQALTGLVYGYVSVEDGSEYPEGPGPRLR